MHATSKNLLCLAGLLGACSAESAHGAARDATQLDASADDAERDPDGDATPDAGAPQTDGAQPPTDAAQQPEAGSATRDAGRGSDAAAALVKQPWPTPDMLMAVDPSGTFANNLSALGYEPAHGAAPARLWALQNEPPALFRLLWDGALWSPDAAEGWTRGKTLSFPNGSGRPDTEGITLLPSGSEARFLYVASERNTDSAAGRQSVLRFDVSASGGALMATHEWNLTSAFPSTALNMGLEAIAFVPDAAAAGLLDESGQRYTPSAYAEHAGGLFLVGVEATGMIYAFVLDHQSGEATRVASIASGLPSVMALEFDADSGYLWAHCDLTCDNRTLLLEPDAESGRFVPRRELAAAPGAQRLDLEGLAIAPDAECSDGRKGVFWAEDIATDGRAIRHGTVPCGRSW